MSKKNYFYSFLIIIFFSTVSVFASKFSNTNNRQNVSLFDSTDIKYCKNISYEESLYLHPDNFSPFNLDLNFQSERKWRTALFKNLIESEENEKKSDGWRNFRSKMKRQEAYFIINVENKIKCKLGAKVRIHGDLLDHNDTTIIPSLNVNLIDGHIFGITKFILFLPETRNSDNEIFAANLFSELKFLSPRTAYINLNYKNHKKKMIFQEKINKELIEQKNLKEGPIIEGDERFAFSDKRHDQNLSKHRLVNKNWSLKNEKTLEIAKNSLSILNFITEVHSTNLPTDNFDYHTMGKMLFDYNFFDNLSSFDAISIALGSDHMMPKNERRFYYDPLNKKFHPIYYDGAIYFLKGENKIIDIKDMIIPSAQEGAKNALLRISKINVENFNKKINRMGLKMSSGQTQQIIDQIKENLVKISNYDENNIFKISEKKKANSFVLENSGYDHNKSRKLVFNTNYKNKFLECDIYYRDCNEIILNSNEKGKLIAQNLKNKKKEDLIFVGKAILNNGSKKWLYEINNKKNVEKINLDDSEILLFGSIDLKIDYEKKQAHITKKNNDQKIVIKNGKIEDWNFIFVDKTTEPSNFRSDEFNLTGCLNFYDVNLKNIKIEITGSKCEDAVNFVRNKGQISKIKITDSEFDSVDFDFSTLLVKDLQIDNAKNDCLDFSFGKYKIENAVLNYCGDKGVSIGEMSTLKIKDIKISNSNSGIVSKDFSFNETDSASFKTTKYCLEAYNKKQEFSGGFISIKNLSCDASNIEKFSVSSNSKIELDNAF